MNTTEQGLDEPGRFACPVCQTRCESIGDKKRHMRSEHPADRQRTTVQQEVDRG